MRFLLAMVMCVVGLAAQPAVFQPFGQGCTFQGQTAAIGNQGLPRPGQQFQVMYAGPNFTMNSAQQIAWPNLVLGLQQQITPIPPLLQQPVGCGGLISPDVLLPTPPDQNGRPMFENFVALAVPNNSQLLGVQFYAQWVVLVDQCGFAGCGLAAILTSDAALAQIGV